MRCPNGEYYGYRCNSSGACISFHARNVELFEQKINFQRSVFLHFKFYCGDLLELGDPRLRYPGRVAPTQGAHAVGLQSAL